MDRGLHFLYFTAVIPSEIQFEEVELSAYLSHIHQQPSVERALIRTKPELRVIVRRDRKLEITWRREDAVHTTRPQYHRNTGTFSTVQTSKILWHTAI